MTCTHCVLIWVHIVTDVLCEGVRVGGEYSVIGVPIHRLSETSQKAHVSTKLEVLRKSSEGGREGGEREGGREIVICALCRLTMCSVWIVRLSECRR